MTKTPDDPILISLAELPEVPLDPAAADAVRRRARVALVDRNVHGSAPSSPSPALVRLSFAWSTAVLPAILLVSGGVYAWGAVRMMERIFLS